MKITLQFLFLMIERLRLWNYYSWVDTVSASGLWMFFVRTHNDILEWNSTEQYSM